MTAIESLSIYCWILPLDHHPDARLEGLHQADSNQLATNTEPSDNLLAVVSTAKKRSITDYRMITARAEQALCRDTLQPDLALQRQRQRNSTVSGPSNRALVDNRLQPDSADLTAHIPVYKEFRCSCRFRQPDMAVATRRSSDIHRQCVLYRLPSPFVGFIPPTWGTGFFARRETGVVQ